MTKKDNKQKYKITLIVLAFVAVVVVFGALLGENISEKNNLVALNEAIKNTADVKSGSSTGYTLGYIEGQKEVQQNDRMSIFTQTENQYTFNEVAMDKASGNIISELYVSPGKYYEKVENKWTMQVVDTSKNRMTPYVIYRMITPINSSQVSSIEKEEGERPGYRVSFSRQWITTSYQGKDTPLTSEAFFETKEIDGKQIISSMEQVLRTRRKLESGGTAVSVFEDKAFLRVNETEDGKSPAEELDKYFKDNVENKWTLANIDEIDTSNAQPIIGSSDDKKE